MARATGTGPRCRSRGGHPRRPAAGRPGPDHRPHRARGGRWLGHRGGCPRGCLGRPGPPPVVGADHRRSAPWGRSAGWPASSARGWSAMAILPASSRSLPDRLAATPFLDWLGPQLGLADVLSLLLFAGFGWLRRPLAGDPRLRRRVVRSRALPRRLAHERHPLLRGREAHRAGPRSSGRRRRGRRRPPRRAPSADPGRRPAGRPTMSHDRW